MPITIDGNGTISGISAGGLPDSSVTSADIADAAVTPTKLSQPLTLATALAYNWNGLTTNTSLDFTGIPSWVKRITVMFAGVSTNGTSGIMIQLGDSGGVETTSYVSTVILVAAASTGVAYTTGFGLIESAAANLYSGQAIISLQDSTTNTWTYSSSMTSGSTTLQLGGGGKSTSATLDRVRITTVGGTNYFDAGSINIMYE